MTSFSTQVHVTLTTDRNKIFKALQPLEPKPGTINFVTAIRIAYVSNTHTHAQSSLLFSVVVTGMYDIHFTSPFLGSEACEN